MLLAEELMLASLDPESGRPLNGSETPIPPCLSGALVAELALAGLVLLERKKFVAIGQPPGPGLLHEAYEVLAEGRGRRSADQLRRVGKDLGHVRSRVVDGLIDQGVLGREDRGLLRVTAHPLQRPELRAEVVQRLRTAAAGDGELEPRTAVLLSLVGPARLLEVVADKPRGHAKRRIAEATELVPLAAVVKKVIAEAASAASAGALAAVSVAAVS